MILKFGLVPKYREMTEMDWIFTSEALLAEGWKFYRYVWEKGKVKGVILEKWDLEIL